MNAITLIVLLAIVDVSYPFYMIPRPGGVFRLRNDANYGTHHYPDRHKKALYANDPYHDNYYNHDYGYSQPMMMDYSMEDGNGQGVPRISISTNGMNYNGKIPVDLEREVYHI